MEQIRFVSLVAALIAVGCKPEANETPVGPSPAAASEQAVAEPAPVAKTSEQVPNELPSGSLVIVSVANADEVLTAFERFVAKIDAKSAATFAESMAPLRGSGLAADKPVHVVVLDPQTYSTPLAIVATSDKPQIFEEMMPGIGSEKIGNLTLFGTDDVRNHVRDWAREKLPGREAPKNLTAYLNLKELGAKYQAFKPLMLMSMGSADARSGKFAASIFEFVEELGGQMEDVTVAFEVNEERINLTLATGALPSTTMADFIADQQDAAAATGLKFAEEVGAAKGATMFGGGVFAMERSGKAIAAWTGQLFAEVLSVPVEESTRLMELWLAGLQGEWVMESTFENLTMHGVYAVRVKDQAKAKSVVNEVLPKLYGKKWKFLDMMAFDGKGCSKDTLGDLQALNCKGSLSATGADKIPGFPRDMSLLVALDGNVLYMGIDDHKRAVGLRRRVRKGTPAGATSAGLRLAKDRSEAFYIEYDLASLMASSLSAAKMKVPKVSSSDAPVEYAMGAKDGRIWVRLGAPAEAISGYVDLIKSISANPLK